MRAVAAAAAALLVLAGCSADGGTGGGADSKDSIGFTQGDGTVTIVPEEDRHLAPELSGPSLVGEETLSSEQFAGKPTVINVWGSWCAPCRAEAPALVEAAEALGDDVQFLGLNTRDLDPAPAQAFVRAFEIPYPNIFDPSGELLLGFGELPPTAIPSTLVVDAEGRVAARVIGEVDANTLIELVGEAT